VRPQAATQQPQERRLHQQQLTAAHPWIPHLLGVQQQQRVQLLVGLCGRLMCSS
jgi:hypothetical protein